MMVENINPWATNLDGEVMDGSGGLGGRHIRRESGDLEKAKKRRGRENEQQRQKRDRICRGHGLGN